MSNSQVQSFSSDKKFFDTRNYPQGFQRSGDFTRTQAQLLEAKGVALKALHEGSRQPQTPEEEHFVATCTGQSKPATDVEKVWGLYLAALRRKQIYFTASSAAVEGGSSESIDSDD
ncbi:MAG: DUF413 domain-containing protein [Venatoribacter sp.]